MKIGDFEFITMTGDVGSYVNKVEDEIRPGLDGHTFRLLGRRGEQFTIQTSQTFNSLLLAKKTMQSYEILTGNFTNIELPQELAYRKVFVHNIKTKIIELLASTDKHEFMLKSTWTLQRTGI